MINIANALTLSRFVFAPVFLYLLLMMEGRDTVSMDFYAIVVLAVAMLTDLFDGIVARASNTVTDFGKIMDPVADSTFFLTAFFGFVVSGRFAVPIWIPLIVLYREIAMHVLRRYAALRGIVLAAKFSGKAKMVIQAVLTSALLLLVTAIDMEWVDMSLQMLRKVTFWTLLIIAVVNVLSMIEYLKDASFAEKAVKEKSG
jgi:CDP-diacylglycerol--glycerol-3-phosphate 3-phosphatidyltransferase